MRGFLLLLIIQFTGQVHAQGPDTLYLDGSRDVANLDTYFKYYVDEEGQASVYEISSDKNAQFRTNNGKALRTGITDDAYWIKLDIRSTFPLTERYIIEFVDPSLVLIELYEAGPNGDFKASKTGVGVSQNERDLKGNKNSLHVEIEPGVTKTYYLRITSTNSMTFSALLIKSEIAFQQYSKERIFLGIFYGALLILALFNVLLFITTRFRVFVYYGLYIVFIGLFTGAADGFFAENFHFFVKFTRGYQDVVTATMTNLLGIVFMLEFLNVSNWSKKFYNFSRVVMVFIGSAVIIAILLDPAFAFLTLQYLGFIVLTMFIIGGILAVRQRVPQSNYFLAAFGVFGFFILLFILNLFRVVPYSFVVQYSIHFGYALSIIILSYGLGVRIYSLYQELIKREKEKKEFIIQKNKELEIKVAERTADILAKEINLRAILNNNDNAIWLVAPGYRLIDYNQVFDELWEKEFGFRLERGINIVDLIPDKGEKKKWRKRYDHALKGESHIYVDTFVIDNEEHSFEVRSYPIVEADEVVGISFFSKDITEQLHAEKQLKTQNQMLKKVNKELDSFVYSASHDLKAPLASVLGLINLVKREVDLDRRKEYYSMMERSVVRLDQFIKDIIDYSRNERTELKQININLSTLIDDIFEDLKYLNGTDEIEKNINIHEKLKFISDPTRVKVVLRNLISNAIRYGCLESDTKRIDISAVNGDTNVRIEIRDYGQGISDDEKKRIFEMFYRANEGSSGTGLGLYIVRETLEKLHGKIDVNNHLEKGVAFIVEIPSS